MNRYIVGIDQSTSGTKVVLVDRYGEIIYKDSMSHKQYYPQPGWVEHDPEEIINNVTKLIVNMLYQNKKHIRNMVGLSITNQRETIVLWDSETGDSLCPAIVWQCRRSADICKSMIAAGHEDTIIEKTGLKLDPYFSASKIKWAIDHHESVQKSMNNGTLRIGTIDSWLIYKLTKGKSFVTDHTNASRTMLYNITTCDWDDELLTLFGLERYMLPSIKSCNDTFGDVDKSLVGIALPIVGVIGDSQGALFGQQCFEIGTGKVTYGTGSSILFNTGANLIRSDKGIVTSVAWNIDGKTEYALEGIINSSGDTLRWVKDNLGLFTRDDEIDDMIASLDSNEGVYIVPAFVGLGAPYWVSDAKAIIVGLSRKSNKNHIVRAAVESMAYQVSDLIKLMESESGTELLYLNADGGPTKNKFLMQLQADLTKTPIDTSIYEELSVLGAVYLGGIGIGLWKGINQLKELKKYDQRYIPTDNTTYVETLLLGWQKAIQKVID